VILQLVYLPPLNVFSLPRGNRVSSLTSTSDDGWWQQHSFHVIKACTALRTTTINPHCKRLLIVTLHCSKTPQWMAEQQATLRCKRFWPLLSESTPTPSCSLRPLPTLSTHDLLLHINAWELNRSGNLSPSHSPGASPKMLP